jgi:hypothetical protein
MRQKVSEMLDMENQNGLYQSIFNDICSIRPKLLNSSDINYSSIIDAELLQASIVWELSVLKKEDIMY